MVTVPDALPPELMAVTVYVTADDTTVGVPEISPVEVSNTRPDGSVVDIVQDTTVPPLEVGVAAVIVESLVSVRKLGLYEIEDGGISMTSMVIVVLPVPPSFVANTV